MEMLLIELVDFLWVAEFLLSPKPLMQKANSRMQISIIYLFIFTYLQLYEIGDYEIRVLANLRRKVVSLFYGSHLLCSLPLLSTRRREPSL